MINGSTYPINENISFFCFDAKYSLPNIVNLCLEDLFFLISLSVFLKIFESDLLDLSKN